MLVTRDLLHSIKVLKSKQINDLKYVQFRNQQSPWPQIMQMFEIVLYTTVDESLKFSQHLNINIIINKSEKRVKFI